MGSPSPDSEPRWHILSMLHREQYQALPMARIHAHDGLHHDSQQVIVTVDDKPVARIPVTAIAFERRYQQGHGLVTFTCVSDPAAFITRPKLRHDD